MTNGSDEWNRKDEKVGPFKVVGYLGDQMGDFPNDQMADFEK